MGFRTAAQPMRPHRVDVALVAYDAVLEERLRAIAMTLELKPAHYAMVPRKIGLNLGGECVRVFSGQSLILSPLSPQCGHGLFEFVDHLYGLYYVTDL